MAPNNKKKKKAKGTTTVSSSAKAVVAGASSSSSSHHNKQPRKCSIPELIQAAEHAATNMMDIKNAITLYTMALQKVLVLIQQQQQQDHDTGCRTERQVSNDTTNTTTTTPTIAILLEIYEKRAELYIEIQHTDLALQDYQEILLYLQQRPSTPQSQPSTSSSTTTSMDTTSMTNFVRQATIHMSMGQLSNSDMALQSYQMGKQCLQTALTMISSSRKVVVVSTTTATTIAPTSTSMTTTDTTMSSSQLQLLQDEIQQQYCRACCCIAELYLTDLCYSDNAEQCCEESLQESLSIIHAASSSATSNSSPNSSNSNNNNNIHCIETYQMIASLRFSQTRNTEAHEYMKRVYEPISVGCQALAVLVGLRTNSGDNNNNNNNNNTDIDDHTTTEDDTDQMAIELTALEHVQSLPPIEFRISTSKLLLECAGTLPYGGADPHVSTTTTTTTQNHDTDRADVAVVDDDDDDVRNYNATPEQQEYAIMAMDVIGSCLAEQDEMYECWILLGDAMIFLEKESALSYWNRAVQILQPIQQQLQQELLDNDQHQSDNGMNDKDDDNEDPIQQQFDTIVMEMDQLQERMDWAVRSGYEDGSGTATNNNNHHIMVTHTTDGMEE